MKFLEEMIINSVKQDSTNIEPCSEQYYFYFPDGEYKVNFDFFAEHLFDLEKIRESVEEQHDINVKNHNEIINKNKKLLANIEGLPRWKKFILRNNTDKKIAEGIVEGKIRGIKPDYTLENLRKYEIDFKEFISIYRIDYDRTNVIFEEEIHNVPLNITMKRRGNSRNFDLRFYNNSIAYVTVSEEIDSYVIKEFTYVMQGEFAKNSYKYKSRGLGKFLFSNVLHFIEKEAKFNHINLEIDPDGDDDKYSSTVPITRPPRNLTEDELRIFYEKFGFRGTGQHMVKEIKK